MPRFLKKFPIRRTHFLAVTNQTMTDHEISSLKDDCSAEYQVYYKDKLYCYGLHGETNIVHIGIKQTLVSLN